MDINESERHSRRDDHWIDSASDPTRRISNHSFNETREILGTRADVIGKRIVIRAVVHPHEATFGTESKAHEPRIADHDPLQSFQLGDAELARTRLADDLTPSRGALRRCLFALNRK